MPASVTRHGYATAVTFTQAGACADRTCGRSTAELTTTATAQANWLRALPCDGDDSGPDLARASLIGTALARLARRPRR